MKINKLRNIQVILIYLTLIAVVITVIIVATIGIGEFAHIGPFKDPETTRRFVKYFEQTIGVFVLVVGPILLILSFTKGIPTNPMAFTTLNSPFDSTEALHLHMRTVLSRDGYHDDVTMMGDAGLEQFMCYKTTLSRTYVFGIVNVPILDQISKASLEELTNKYMEQHLEKLTKDVYLTLLICVGRGSKDYSNFIRRYGQTLGRFYVHIGFNFDHHTMSFVSKIDGFAAGKRKKLLRDFLAMLPDQ
jgi:hypothetical protein